MSSVIHIAVTILFTELSEAKFTSNIAIHS